MTWGRLARSACSDCGSTAIVWTTAIDLPWRAHPGGVPIPGSAVPVAGPRHSERLPQNPDALEERKRMWAAINFCGPDAEAWWCDACQGWGVFTDTERML